MPVLFPGMNPYLEHPDLWPDVHRRFIQVLAEVLANQVPDCYEVAVRKRIYRVSGEDALVVGHPGLTVHPTPPLNNQATPKHSSALNKSAAQAAKYGHSNGNSPSVTLTERSTQPIPVYVPVPQDVREDYIEIVEPGAGEVVTVIEVLTPKKKRAGRGRITYEQHRESILGSPTHFVEIDFLRGWEPTAVYGPDGDSDYRILISRSEQRPKADLYTWNVNDPIPVLQLPLRRAQECSGIDLKQILDKAYERSGYDLIIDYRREPLPPLRDAEAHWLAMFLKQLGLRENN
jgi:hypothetical protein